MGKNRKYLWAALAVCVWLSGCSAKEAEQPVKETPTETESVSPGPLAPDSPTIEPFPEEPSQTFSEGPEDEGKVRLVIASDLHYFSKELTDFGQSFTYMAEHGDGKVVHYVWQITDAFIREVVRERPDALIISGDLSLDGEKVSHLELAEKLKRVETAGIPVLVIPGNHDINNIKASAYEGSGTHPAEHIRPEEFSQIYEEFGYGEALSRDEYSLSYIYPLNGHTWLVMLDTCQYVPVNQVGGMLKTETYEWLWGKLEDAWAEGINVIPVSHHNLLNQSEVYTDNCTIEHSEELIEHLEGFGIGLYLSGHLHVQHYMKHGEGDIYEIVTSSLSTPPCQYGILDFWDDASFQYRTKAVDMERWAAADKMTDPNLLRFRLYGNQFLKGVFYNQVQDECERSERLKNLTKEQKDEMARVYADLNAACYAGKAVEIKDEAVGRPGYTLWEKYGYPSILSQYLDAVVKDANRDYNSLESE